MSINKQAFIDGCFAPEQVEPMQKIGVPINMISDMDEMMYSSGGGGYVAVTNNPAHPKAQKVLVNWLLSKEGQTVLSKSILIPSLRVDVPTDFLSPGSVPILGKVHFQTEKDTTAKRDVWKWSADIMKEMGY